MAAAWWRLKRLHTRAQVRLASRLGGGSSPLYALKEVEAIGPEEARLERSLQRLRKDLAFLQRYRRDTERRGVEDVASAFAAQMAADSAQMEAYLREKRTERQRARELDAETAVPETDEAREPEVECMQSGELEAAELADAERAEDAEPADAAELAEEAEDLAAAGRLPDAPDDTRPPHARPARSAA
jgi:hypothetical protein